MKNVWATRERANEPRSGWERKTGSCVSDLQEHCQWKRADENRWPKDKWSVQSNEDKGRNQNKLGYYLDWEIGGQWIEREYLEELGGEAERQAKSVR
jgi:hypothetical protein